MIAHINEAGLEQSLLEHLIGTANKAKYKGQKLSIGNIMFITGLLHDLGKNSKLFEDYLKKAVIDPSSVKRGEVDHSTAGGKFVYDKYYNENQIRKITAQIISAAIINHHGLNDMLDIEGVDNFGRRMNKCEEIKYFDVLKNSSDTIFKFFDLDKLFDLSFEEMKNISLAIKDIVNDMEDKDSAFYIFGCLERLILSILIDSDRTDTAEFMNGLVLPSSNSVDDIYELWDKMIINLSMKIESFKGTDYISVLRKEISDECHQFSHNPTGIYCLPIPTGGGKTLSGLRYALEHAKKFSKEHIIYVAPYLSILEQNADEYRKALNINEHILEHHSNIVLDVEDDRYEYLKETWDSPIIMTTMVQFLDVLFSGNSQNIRRMNQLANSVVIIDEIQSLPIKCVSLFNVMMNFLSRICNTTVILCSATQPLLDDVKKKILYGKPKYMTIDVEKQFNDFKRTEIVDKTVRGGYNREELSEFVLGKMESNDNILIILNTKSSVRNLYSEIENKIKISKQHIEIVQLTTYMCAENRSDIINDLKIKLKSKKIICISSQLIEAGVDISFQCVVRALAGLDNIAQAAGRCNRNGEKELGYVYIINYKEENLSHLKDIKIAQESTQKILDDLLIQKDSNIDLLSPKLMNKFYEIYFYNRINEMNYTIKEKNTDMYDLLSINTVGKNAYKERNNNEYPLQLKQAFKYAAQNFEVIGNNTIGLIVPYKDNFDSINIVKNSYDIKEIKNELKKIQRYTVNLYKDDAMIKKLIGRNAIDNSILNGNILLLREGFYNEKTGVCDELEDLIM